jgi:hypothetical protein
MRRLLLASAVLFSAACAGQSTDPCVMKLDVNEVANIQLATTATAHAKLQPKSGSCSSTLKGSLTWNSSNTAVLSILTSNDSTASLRGLKAGTSILSAWLTRTPTIRDSVTVSVVTATDVRPAR